MLYKIISLHKEMTCTIPQATDLYKQQFSHVWLNDMLHIILNNLNSLTKLHEFAHNS